MKRFEVVWAAGHKFVGIGLESIFNALSVEMSKSDFIDRFKARKDGVATTVLGTMRLLDVGSMSLHEGELRIKVLKRLYAKGKAYPFNNFQRASDLHTELTKAVHALGIKRAMVYHGINVSETYEPVGIAIKRISDCIDGRLSQMKQRQVA